MPSSKGEDYLLIISGPENYTPFLAGWQEFKDNLRKIVENQPGWTDVRSGPERGQTQGWCKLDRKSDAEATYAYYTTRCRGVLVHLFKTSQSSSNFKLLKCNCCHQFAEVSERGHSPNRSGIQAKYTSNLSDRDAYAPQQYAVPTYSYPVYQQAAAYPTAPVYPAYQTYPAYAPMQMMAPQMAVYSGGVPVNMSNGAVLTEARGIFIGGMNYKAGPHDLISLLNQVGRPVETNLHKDSRSGQFKGSATAKFATVEEAQQAVSRLNGTTHMGKTINVRFDTEKTVVGQVQSPVIVNGSTFPTLQYGTHA